MAHLENSCGISPFVFYLLSLVLNQRNKAYTSTLAIIKMKLRKTLKKYEIYFTVLTSTLLAVMAIIISYYTYNLSYLQTSISEFESRPNFIISKENQGTDSLYFKIEIDESKLKNLFVRTITRYDVQLDSIYKTKNSGGTNIAINRKFYKGYNSLKPHYDLKNRVINLKYTFPDEEKNFRYFLDSFNKKINDGKGNGFEIQIGRSILFQICYQTYSKKEIKEYYELQLDNYFNGKNFLNNKYAFSYAEIENSKHSIGDFDQNIFSNLFTVVFSRFSNYDNEKNQLILYNELLNR